MILWGQIKMLLNYIILFIIITYFKAKELK
jgi:uncharacterized protein with PQ loop repeat